VLLQLAQLGGGPAGYRVTGVGGVDVDQQVLYEVGVLRDLDHALVV
jgi:hypothetical protein